MKKTLYYIFAIIISICIINQYIELIDYVVLKRTHPPNLPLVDTKDDFLSPKECKELKEYIHNNKLLNREWEWCDIIHFNTSENSKKMFFKNNLEKIYEIFEKIKQPGTNAYIVNTAIISNSHNANKNKAIDGHYDDSIEMRDWLGRKILPVCTTVIYVSLPKDYKGGELFLSPFGSKYIHKFKSAYKPKEGRKLTFRGDMYHFVTPYFCDDHTEKRISLVFEQYNIPDKYDTEFKIRKR